MHGDVTPPPDGKAMNTKQVRIVDLGRGPQIEGHRLTVIHVWPLSAVLSLSNQVHVIARRREPVMRMT
jgi:hypothetical protein